MVAVLILFCVVVAVCMMAVMRLSSTTDNIMYIPSIVVLVLEVVAVIGLAVSWVKSRKEEKEKEDDGC